MKRILQLTTLSTLLLAAPVRSLTAQTATDSAAIRATALDYIQGWYTNNAERMERALHPHLAKRLVWADSTGRSHLVDLTALELIQGTRSHPATPATERRDDVTILSTYGNVAMVRIEATDWVDFLQMVKWNRSWKILNVVWENRPERMALGGKERTRR
jgi:Putative lumazine-binding